MFEGSLLSSIFEEPVSKVQKMDFLGVFVQFYTIVVVLFFYTSVGSPTSSSTSASSTVLSSISRSDSYSIALSVSNLL